MSTIAKRLRELVSTANETTKGAVMRAVLKVAAELEAAPAADAVPVAGHLPGRHRASCAMYDPVPDCCDCGAKGDALVRQRDHLSAIAALQAQIASLRAQAQHAEDVVEAAKDRIDELTAELEARKVPNREAFEMWFASSRRSRGAGKRPTFARLPDDTYADDHTQRHWWTWQCALAAPSNPTTQPPEGR